jgi:SRSO17 transposase
MVVVIRYDARDNQQGVQVDYWLSNAAPETLLGACARVAKAAHRLEACLQRSTSEAGVADEEGRHWTGWQQPQTLSLLATWFLGKETQRGKKMDPCDHLTPDSPRHRNELARGMSVWDDVA